MPLKLAIVASGIAQRDLAFTTRIGEVRLSGIIHGHKVATVEERRTLAKVLRKRQSHLFAEPRRRRPKPPPPVPTEGASEAP